MTFNMKKINDNLGGLKVHNDSVNCVNEKDEEGSLDKSKDRMSKLTNKYFPSYFQEK